MRIVCRFSCNILPYFCRKLGKMWQNLSVAAVVIGAFRVKHIDFLKLPVMSYRIYLKGYIECTQKDCNFMIQLTF